MQGGRVSIDVVGVRVAYGAQPALDGVTLSVGEGEWLGIIGPNGSGKTTLLRVIGAYLRAREGLVLLCGRPVERYRAAERARVLAALGTDVPADFGFTVAEYVHLGRTPHAATWFGDAPSDRAEVERALRATGSEHLAARPLDRLSAGERQRVHLARALAQRPRVLLLDEPTVHLDLAHQVEVLRQVDRLRQEERVTVVAVMHDLNLAALFCQRLALLERGRVVAVGRPADVLREDLLQQAYGCRVAVIEHPVAGVPQVLPLRDR